MECAGQNGNVDPDFKSYQEFQGNDDRMLGQVQDPSKYRPCVSVQIIYPQGQPCPQTLNCLSIKWKNGSQLGRQGEEEVWPAVRMLVGVLWLSFVAGISALGE